MDPPVAGTRTQKHVMSRIISRVTPAPATTHPVTPVTPPVARAQLSPLAAASGHLVKPGSLTSCSRRLGSITGRGPPTGQPEEGGLGGFRSGQRQGSMQERVRGRVRGPGLGSMTSAAAGEGWDDVVVFEYMNMSYEVFFMVCAVQVVSLCCKCKVYPCASKACVCVCCACVRLGEHAF